MKAKSSNFNPGNYGKLVGRFNNPLQKFSISKQLDKWQKQALPMSGLTKKPKIKK